MNKDKLADLIIITFKIILSFAFIGVYFFLLFNLYWGIFTTLYCFTVAIGYYLTWRDY